jgi:hypothetical protein
VLTAEGLTIKFMSLHFLFGSWPTLAANRQIPLRSEAPERIVENSDIRL